VSTTGHSGDDRQIRNPENGSDGTWLDPKILEDVRRRDQRALGVFFDGAFPYVYNLAFRLMGNKETAEDVTQDVFVKVYQAADRLRTDRNPKPWLTTITYNTCRDAARRSAARPEQAENGGLIGERLGDASTPEDELIGKERRQLAERALRELDEESRAVVILHDFCGTTHEDIAEMMGLSHASVRKRYSRTLKRMAETIKGFLK
jgi:RNA polymerase sigma-70 factor (ECF subfamily)